MNNNQDYCQKDPSNVTTIPQVRWYLYSKLQCEFYKFSPIKAVWKYLEVIMLH